MLIAAEIQAVARVLHELGDNAANMARSRSRGHVSVCWNRKANGGWTNLMLVWQEHGGPPVNLRFRPAMAPISYESHSTRTRRHG